MRVLHIVKTNLGAKWAFDQAKWLFDNGVDIITVLPEVNGGMSEKYKEAGMKIIQMDVTLPLKSPLRFFSRKKEISKLINDVQPDLIHTHFVTNILMLRLALKKVNIPRVFQVPGPLHLENTLFRNLEIKISDQNDYWIGTCKKTCEIYRDFGVPESKVFLNYYGGYGGITINNYLEKGSKLKDEFKISSDKILVGMISYFYKPKWYLGQTRGLKGHEDFIDAIAIARRKNPEILGVIIGGPWGNSDKYMEKIKLYAARICPNGIVFTGFRNDVKAIYKEFDLVVHPSHSENLGGAAESLAAGVPTISTNVGGFPDIVLNGETGYTVDMKSPSKLAETILLSLSNTEKSEKMSNKGKMVISSLLDIDNTGKKLINIMRKINNAEI